MLHGGNTPGLPATEVMLRLLSESRDGSGGHTRLRFFCRKVLP